MVKKIFRIILLLIIIAIAGVTLFLAAVNFEFFGHVYSRKELKQFKNQTATRIYTRDGVLIGKFFDKNRTNITYEQLPKHVVDALVATEDARYFEHEGVDSRSLLRVLFKTIILNDASSGGGSTITQQLLKNMYGRKRFGALTMLVNKTKEGILATRLESIYTKKEILALYLNTVPFGENVFGIEAASYLFFNKSITGLSLGEGAVLVGMLKANTYYNPRLYPEHAFKRRNVVLYQMVNYEYLNKTVYDSLKLLPIVLDYANLESEGPANYFIVEVKKELKQILLEVENKTGEKWDYRADGLVVETTLDNKLQHYALSSFRQHLSVMQKRLRKQYASGRSHSQLNKMIQKELKKRGIIERAKEIGPHEIFTWNGTIVDSISVADSISLSLTTLQSGLLAINPKTGDVLAYVGGIDFRTQPYNQINARRQLASTFKPILYASAIEKGMAPCYYLSNSAKNYEDFDNWKPSNYDHSEGGMFSLTGALIKSKNIPSVNLLFEVGFDEVDYLWRKMGFSYELQYTPSMALGTGEANLMELAKAYATFANGGFKIESKTILRIKTADGKVIYERKTEAPSSKIIEERTSILMNEMLQKAINQGTGTSIRNKYNVKMPLAGKTGTSQNFADAWFASYNPSMVMVARVGASSPNIHFNNGANGSGGRLALPLVGLTLQQIEQNTKELKLYGKDFKTISDTLLLEEMNCEDYLDETGMEKFFNMFKSSTTTTEKEVRKSSRKSTNRNSKKRKKKRRKWFKR